MGRGDPRVDGRLKDRAGRPVQRLARLRVPADAARLAPVRRRLAQTLAPLALDPGLVDGLVLAVHEACANVIRHAYGDAADAGDIIVTVLRQGSELVVRIRDFAPPTNPGWLGAPDAPAPRPGGLGLRLMRGTMDTITCSPAPGRGHRLEMRRRLDREGAP